MVRTVCLGALVVTTLLSSCAQPQDDSGSGSRSRQTSASLEVSRGSDSLVCFDSGHGNYHTADEAYFPFAELLRSDGFSTATLEDSFTESALESCSVLVIATPVHSANKNDWSLPHASAFTTAEIRDLFEWTHRGGGLMLIVDHSPIPGALAGLATLLGLAFVDGEARNDPNEPLPDIFERGAGTLHEHPITIENEATGAVSRVATWTGSAFRASREFLPLMSYGPRSRSWVEISETVPEIASAENPVFEVEGWLAAAARPLGAGRVVVLGEVAMCTDQENRGRRSGFKTEEGAENSVFCLNAIRWLDRQLEPG